MQNTREGIVLEVRAGGHRVLWQSSESQIKDGLLASAFSGSIRIPVRSKGASPKAPETQEPFEGLVQGVLGGFTAVLVTGRGDAAGGRDAAAVTPSQVTVWGGGAGNGPVRRALAV